MPFFECLFLSNVPLVFPSFFDQFLSFFFISFFLSFILSFILFSSSSISVSLSFIRLTFLTFFLHPLFTNQKFLLLDFHLKDIIQTRLNTWVHFTLTLGWLFILTITSAFVSLMRVRQEYRSLITYRATYRHNRKLNVFLPEGGQEQTTLSTAKFHGLIHFVNYSDIDEWIERQCEALGALKQTGLDLPLLVDHSGFFF